jgi:hypothetical protein
MLYSLLARFDDDELEYITILSQRCLPFVSSNHTSHAWESSMLGESRHQQSTIEMTSIIIFFDIRALLAKFLQYSGNQRCLFASSRHPRPNAPIDTTLHTCCRGQCERKAKTKSTIYWGSESTQVHIVGGIACFDCRPSGVVDVGSNFGRGCSTGVKNDSCLIAMTTSQLRFDLSPSVLSGLRLVV